MSGDKLFVFGGRRLSKRKTHLTSDLYELDLISRNWTKLRTSGKIPAPRYFHTACALGDTKLVCYGGMAAASFLPEQSPGGAGPQQQAEPGIVVMSDIHLYDIATATWTLVPTSKAPPGRYAHCAAILPSYSIGTAGYIGGSSSSGDIGKGGAEMIIVGGQDGASQYIEQISVFNLRSLSWRSTTDLGRSCGAYRSVVAPLTSLRASEVGAWANGREPLERDDDDDEVAAGHTTLIYSNYNFLDVRLELQLRLPDGSVVEKQMKKAYTPPGLRFPNGDVVANHFVVSGTLITSNRQEYALWALDLRTLQWFRIDTGPGILNNGSWNRGLVWKKRSQFVVLGDRRRKLDEDYNHRRLNFSNICTVELEAFGLYDNPVITPPAVGFASASSPIGNLPDLPTLDRPAPSEPGQVLGRSAAELREIADMDILAIGGERVAVNFHIIARRWGPYLTQLLDGVATRPGATRGASDDDEERRNTLLATSTSDVVSRNSSITITPDSVQSFTSAISSALDSITSDARTLTPSHSSTSTSFPSTAAADMDYKANTSLDPLKRSRVLFLPHTFMTVRALVYYLYTWSLPPQGTPLCSPQILCSLLQLARPYRINGLLEATVERLHESFDGKTTAAIFNAAAMAAGGGDALAFAGQQPNASMGARGPSSHSASANFGVASFGMRRPRRGTDPTTDSEDDGGSMSMSSSATSLSSLNDPGLRVGNEDDVAGDDVWTGELSGVVGLQKRGLRGLMEGRAMREKLLGEEAVQGREAGRRGSGAAVGLGIGSASGSGAP